MPGSHSAAPGLPPLVVLLLLALMSGSSGCARPGVDVTYDRYTDFSRLRTYRWVEGRQFGVAHREIEGRNIAQIAADAADRRLASRGYRRVETGDVDFFIRNDLDLDYKQADVVVERSDSFYERSAYDEPPGRRVSPPARVREVYAEGIVALEVLEPRESRSLWRAETRATLPLHEPPRRRIRQLEEVIDRLLAKFPPR